LKARNLILVSRPEEARDILLSIRDDNDPHGRTMLLLGHAAWRIGDWGRLRECGEDLVRRHPEMADGYMFLGASAHNAGHLQESLAMFEQAVAREPERAVAQKLLTTVSAIQGAPGKTVPNRASAGTIRSEAP
jgi:tetratricopeptide (TPR) repeat protein